MDSFQIEKSFQYENAYYATCTDKRIAKQIVHYELYKKIMDLPGDLIECGIFKGNSFFELGHYRNILETQQSRKLIGFDIFGKFPETHYEDDKEKRINFIKDAGENSIDIDKMHEILSYKNISNYELIKGDINYTIPEYCKINPCLKIALLHIDVDIYEPTVTILENMYDKIVKGGIVIFDDYSFFPGETKAVDDFFRNKDIKLEKLPFLHKLTFIIKNEF
ncbi:TPA: class I SAM-dependent methyltransferase [Campylobacter coli]|uniref:TylF/MycF/NovP-related O-methyltransferase n=1 Tax=Campylobacter coli TaxID=195 RepID=UPI000931E3A6|nr:TylF/MycF/NovP-related O-methyltransferase [Campylobacter coli]HEF9948449.1 class I SAM-dependent methyltransferase [Campylobacter coli]HEF9964620.1 class I SAM-dependent methyltransferase [Campylobacter coli]